MDFNDTTEEATWRGEVREFLDKEYPKELRRGGRGEGGEGEGLFRSRQANAGGVMKQWRSTLASRGWVAPAWPKEYGGAGLDTKRQFIMNEEFAESGAPNVGGFGVMMFGPDADRPRHARSRRRSTFRASSTARRSGARVVASRARAPTSRRCRRAPCETATTTSSTARRSGPRARSPRDRMYMLARTDPDAPKHRGISYFLLDMRRPASRCGR